MATIKIKNKRTGEVKEVSLQEAEKMGVIPKTENYLAEDTASGKFSVPQLFQKYGSKMEDPNRILEIYNQNSQYGPATESPEALTSFGVDVSKFQPKESNQQKADTGVNIASEVDNIPKNIRDKTGSKEAFNVVAKQKIPVVGNALIRSDTERKLADLESKYFLMVQTALTAVQGSRPSDYDVKSYMDKTGPSIRNSPQVNEDRINNLRKLMEAMGGKSSQNTRPSLESFVIQ